MEHNGFYSYLPAATANAEYYTTTAANEEISFAVGSKPIAVNALLLENCGDAAIYIELNASGYKLCIPAGESREISALTVTKIKIHNTAGAKLRYSGMVV